MKTEKLNRMHLSRVNLDTNSFFLCFQNVLTAWGLFQQCKKFADQNLNLDTLVRRANPSPNIFRSAGINLNYDTPKLNMNIFDFIYVAL